jgi:hypothetical protein
VADIGPHARAKLSRLTEVRVPSIALYYPWRHFQVESQVRLALLTWDKRVRLSCRKPCHLLRARFRQMMQRRCGPAETTNRLYPVHDAMVLIADDFGFTDFADRRCPAGLSVPVSTLALRRR